MKNILRVFLGLVLLGQMANAATVEDVDCFKYYDFQHGLIFNNLMTEKAAYGPGDQVTVTYTLFSQMNAPIVEGSVRAQIFYLDENGDEQMLDEFFVARNINLEYKGTLDQKFVWTIPNGAKSGKYSIKLYFIVGDYFNLAGLSMIPYGPPGVPGEATTFEVKSSGAPSMMYFAKDATLINDVAYKFFGVPDMYEEGTTLKLKTKLVNVGSAKNVKVSFKVYPWDDLVESPINKYTSEKTVSLPADGSVDLSYDLPDMETSTYEVRIVAESPDAKAILKVRIPVKGPRGRFIYLGLDKFPLIKGRQTTLFFCYSGSTDYGSTFKGSGNLEIVDDKGNVILKQGYGPMEIMATPPQGKKITFTPDRDINYLVLKGDMYDETNRLNDQVSLEYDYSKFANIPSKIDVKASASSVAPGQSVKYTVTYTDERGAALKGKVLIYLIDPDGKVINAVSGKEILGEFTGDFVVSGKGGEYKIIARELVQDKKAETSFKVEAESIATTTLPITKEIPTTVPQKPQDNSSYILSIGLVIIIVVLVLFLQTKGKKNTKKKNKNSD